MRHDVTFDNIYKQYYKKSLLFVNSYVNDAAAAEDIVSDSFINLWSAIKKEDVRNPLGMLLFILRNESLIKTSEGKARCYGINLIQIE